MEPAPSDMQPAGKRLKFHQGPSFASSAPGSRPLVEYLRGELKDPPAITAKKDKGEVAPVQWDGPGWSASFKFLAKGGSRAVYAVDDNWVMKYDFWAVRENKPPERNLMEVRLAKKYS